MNVMKAVWVAAAVVWVSVSGMDAVAAPPPAMVVTNPSPMGLAVMAFLRASNSNDLATARSYCTDAHIKSYGSEKRLKYFLYLASREGKLDFGEGKTSIQYEQTSVNGKKFVGVNLYYIDRAGVGHFEYEMFEVNGKWKIYAPLTTD